jgi:hypothetical protein
MSVFTKPNLEHNIFMDRSLLQRSIMLIIESRQIAPDMTPDGMIKTPPGVEYANF